MRARAPGATAAQRLLPMLPTKWSPKPLRCGAARPQFARPGVATSAMKQRSEAEQNRPPGAPMRRPASIALTAHERPPEGTPAVLRLSTARRARAPTAP